MRGNKWPAALPLSIRLSANDGAEGGRTLEDTIALVPSLREGGVDVIDVSPFGLGAAGSPGAELHAGQAAEIRRHTGIATATVGGVTGAGRSGGAGARYAPRSLLGGARGAGARPADPTPRAVRTRLVSPF